MKNEILNVTEILLSREKKFFVLPRCILNGTIDTVKITEDVNKEFHFIFQVRIYDVLCNIDDGTYGGFVELEEAFFKAGGKIFDVLSLAKECLTEKQVEILNKSIRNINLEK